MTIVKNSRVLIWIFFVIISIIAIAPNPNPQGLVITFIENNSTLHGLSVGNIIYKIDDKPVTNAADLEKNFTGRIKIETNGGVRFFNTNGSLGVQAERVQPTNLNFGLDIKGGVRAVIKPEKSDTDTLDAITSTLQTRINVYGLREAVFRPVFSGDEGFIEISIAGGSVNEFKGLLESQGKFEAKIPLLLRVSDNKTVLKLDKDYNIDIKNKTLIVNDKFIEQGERFVINNIPFTFEGEGFNRLNLTATVFTGDDIKIVYFDPQSSRIEDTGNGYVWSFRIQIGNEGAQRFAWVTKNLGVRPDGYLNSNIFFFLDEIFIEDLSIAADLKGRVTTEVSLSGPAATVQEAVAERSKLQSILRSGALPTSIKIVELNSISPNLGFGFLISAIVAGIVAIIGVIFVISLRYRKIKFIVPMVFVSLSEVLIILGIASLINWTIDIAAIAGIIASVGTGVDSQIVIIDQALRKESIEYSMREKLRRAFFIIFGSAGTIIAAMLPLMFLGFGTLRGFAIITIIGVLIGVLITRPAFGKIIEKIV